MSGAAFDFTTHRDRKAFVEWVRDRTEEGDEPGDRERFDRWEALVARNRVQRLKMLAACEEDEGLVGQLLRLCAPDRKWRACAFFIDYFCYTWEPRRREHLCFVLYPVQVEELVKTFCELIFDENPMVSIDWLIEKSRDMGATWVLLACITWAFIFVYGFTALLGAQTDEVVDDGGKNSTSDSLFGRVRYMLKRLPAWMWKELPIGKDKDGTLSFDANESLIMGAPTNANFGRHGRFKMVFVDEGAWLGGTGEPLRAAHTALGDTTRLSVICSTPNGMNYYGQLRHGLLTDEEFVPRITTLWWHTHPLKSKEWLERERARRTAQNFAQEVMIDYQASVTGIVYHEYSINTHVPDDAHHSRHLEIRTALDPGRSDATALLFAQPDRAHGRHTGIFYIERTQKVIDWFVPFYLGYIPEVDHAGNRWQHEYSAREREAIELLGSWFALSGRPAYNYGDEAGYQKTSNYTLSSYQVLSRYGVTIYGVKHEDKRAAVDHSILLLRSCAFTRRCVMERWGDRHSKTFNECMTNYRWKEEQDSGLLRPHRTPLHGIYSHGCDAFQIYASQQPIPAGVSQLDPGGAPASTFGRRKRDRLHRGSRSLPHHRRRTKY